MQIENNDLEFVNELRDLYKKHMKVIDTDDYIFIIDIEKEEDIEKYIEMIGE